MRSRNTLAAMLVLTAGLRAEPVPTEPVIDAPTKAIDTPDPLPIDGVKYDLPILLDDPALWPVKGQPWDGVPYDPNDPNLMYYTMRNDVPTMPPEVPEPTTLILGGLALGAVALRRRRVGG